MDFDFNLSLSWRTIEPSSGPDFCRYIDAKELELILRKGAAMTSLVFNWLSMGNGWRKIYGALGWLKGKYAGNYGFYMFSPSIIVLYYTLLLLILHFRGRHSQLIWEIPASTYEHLDSSCNNVHFQNVKSKQLSSFGCWILTQTIPGSIVPEVLEANIYRTPLNSCW